MYRFDERMAGYRVLNRLIFLIIQCIRLKCCKLTKNMNKAFVIRMELLLLLKWFDSSLCISRILAMNWISPAPLFDIHFGFCGINSSYWLSRLRAKPLHQIFNLRAYENDFFSENVSIWISITLYLNTFALVLFSMRWHLLRMEWLYNFHLNSKSEKLFVSNGGFQRQIIKSQSICDWNEFEAMPCHDMKSVHNKNY